MKEILYEESKGVKWRKVRVQILLWKRLAIIELEYQKGMLHRKSELMTKCHHFNTHLLCHIAFNE